MSEWENTTTLCAYLEMIEEEIIDRIKKANNDVQTLEEIYERIRPIEKPKEKQPDPTIDQLLCKAHKAEFKPTQQTKKEKDDPFTIFSNLVKDFNRIPYLKRESLSHKFIKSLSGFTKITPAHVFHRGIPCIKRLNQELDNVLKCDLDQPAQSFRAAYTTDRAKDISEKLEDFINSFESYETVDPITQEKKDMVKNLNTGKKTFEQQFDMIADIPPKKLTNLYRLRGQARSSLIMARIREKVEEVLIPLIESIDLVAEEDIPDIKHYRTLFDWYWDNEPDSIRKEITKLKMASLGFIIVSEDCRSYALIKNI